MSWTTRRCAVPPSRALTSGPRSATPAPRRPCRRAPAAAATTPATALPTESRPFAATAATVPAPSAADGGGERALLLFCHATGFCKEVLLPVLDELAPLLTRDAAFLALDISGHGDSRTHGMAATVAAERYGWERMLTADIADALGAAAAQGTRLGFTPGATPVLGVGHSMGGAVGVKRAAADDRIELLVSLAGMVHTAKFVKVEFGEETPGSGFMWGKKDCPLSRAFVDDMNQIGSVLDLGGQIKVPWLLVHGTVDDVVPIAESREIFAQAQDPKELVEIENCDHVFDAETDPESLPIMVRKVTEWLLPKTMVPLQS